jgi:hypothetical protein
MRKKAELSINTLRTALLFLLRVIFMWRRCKACLEGESLRQEKKDKVVALS